MSTRYCGILKTELVTPEILAQLDYTPTDVPLTVDKLRKSVDGYCFLRSREPIVGVLIVDETVELQKPEWNFSPESEDQNQDGIITPEEQSIWAKFKAWWNA